MGNTLNNLTVGELIGIMAGIGIIYTFVKNLIVPLVNKWLKIDRNEHDLKALQSLPLRIERLEEMSVRDYKRLNAIDDVNVLVMEALQALVRNRRTNNDVANLKTVEDKIDGFLAGRVRS